MARWLHSDFAATRAWNGLTLDQELNADWGTDANNPNTGDTGTNTVPKQGGTWSIGWSNADAAHNSATWPTGNYSGYVNVTTSSALTTSPLHFVRFVAGGAIRVDVVGVSLNLGTTGTKAFSGISPSGINGSTPAASDAFGMYLVATNDGGHQNGSVALGDQGATNDTFTTNPDWAAAVSETANAGAATGTGTAYAPTISTSETATPGAATAAGTAYAATVAVSTTIAAGNAAGAGAAYDAEAQGAATQPVEVTAYAGAAYAWSGR